MYYINTVKARGKTKHVFIGSLNVVKKFKYCLHFNFQHFLTKKNVNTLANWLLNLIWATDFLYALTVFIHTIVFHVCNHFYDTIMRIKLFGFSYYVCVCVCFLFKFLNLYMNIFIANCLVFDYQFRPFISRSNVHQRWNYLNLCMRLI